MKVSSSFGEFDVVLLISIEVKNNIMKYLWHHGRSIWSLYFVSLVLKHKS